METFLASVVFSPFVLIFAAIFLGMLFGRIKIKSFSFGGAGPLFVGLIIGYFVLKCAKSIGEESSIYSDAQEFISNGVINSLLFDTFLVLFVTAIGLLASNSIGVVIKKYGIKFIILGFLITFVGAAVNFGLTEVLSSNVSFYKVSGVYSGAMTSSPGLAAALESTEREAKEQAENFGEYSDSKKDEIAKVLNEYYETQNIEKNISHETESLTEQEKKDFVNAALSDVGTGHSIAFPFGSLVVIIAMSFLHLIFKIDLKKEKEEFTKIIYHDVDTSKKKSVLFDVTGFSVAALVGLIIGNVTIGSFSLGSTGGALLGGLLFGAIGKIKFINFRMDDKVLQVIRNLCLEIFLAIVGLRYGYNVVNAITGSGWIFAVVSVITATAALMSGFIVGRYVMKLNYVLLSGAICGGMTNTTGMGTLLEVLDSDDAATGYGATFPFAVIGMVIFTILLHMII